MSDTKAEGIEMGFGQRQRASRPDDAFWLSHPEFRAFCAAIRENPDDNVSRLVAADWLQEGGGAAAVYAEFIRESVRCPRRMSSRAKTLLDENLRAWLLPVFSPGKGMKLESAVRKGSFIALRLAYRSGADTPIYANVRLRWARGFVGQAEFGKHTDDRADHPVLEFSRVAVQVALACPAAVMRPSRGSGDGWLRVESQWTGRRRDRLVHHLVVNFGTAQLLPTFGPQSRVVASGFRDSKQAKESIPLFMQPPMTEYAHGLATAALSA